MHIMNTYFIIFYFNIKPIMVKSNLNLSNLQRHVIFQSGTEKPFDNKYWNNNKEEIYVDIVNG